MFPIGTHFLNCVFYYNTSFFGTFHPTI